MVFISYILIKLSTSNKNVSEVTQSILDINYLFWYTYQGTKF